jgi:hypothetical protein
MRAASFSQTVGSGKIPLGMATATERPTRERKERDARNRTPAGSRIEEHSVSRDPKAPVKQPRRSSSVLTPSGSQTWTRAASTPTSHSVPVAFQ